MRKLGAFPPVRRTHFEAGRSYQTIGARYAESPKQPLVVTAELCQRFIPTVERTLHLDGLLAAAVMEDGPPQLHNDEEPTHVVPTPLLLLWVCPKGRPLWASSDLIVAGKAIEGKQYWHKREPSDKNEWCTKPNVNVQAGRWKEARIPMPTQKLADDATLSGIVIGNRDEVFRLLTQYVTHVGKKASVGNGRVAKWSVDPVPWMTEEQALKSILDRRNVPLDYLVETGQMPVLDVTHQRRLKPNRGWTPPYWHAPFWGSVMGPLDAT